MALGKSIVTVIMNELMLLIEMVITAPGFLFSMNALTCRRGRRELRRAILRRILRDFEAKEAKGAIIKSVN